MRYFLLSVNCVLIFACSNLFAENRNSQHFHDEYAEDYSYFAEEDFRYSQNYLGPKEDLSKEDLNKEDSNLIVTRGFHQKTENYPWQGDRYGVREDSVKTKQTNRRYEDHDYDDLGYRNNYFSKDDYSYARSHKKREKITTIKSDKHRHVKSNRVKVNLNSQQILGLSRNKCYSVLKKHKVIFRKLAYRSGVKIPIKIESSLGGVRFKQVHNKSKHSIMDCRLAVALLSWTRILRRFGIDEVVYMRTYTRGAKVRGSGKSSGHSWALAIDAAKFKSKRYGLLDVKYDWFDRRKGVSPCGSIQNHYTAARKVLRSIVCKSVQQNIFAVILTPHYNRAHHDHLHIELRPTKYSMILR